MVAPRPEPTPRVCVVVLQRGDAPPPALEGLPADVRTAACGTGDRAWTEAVNAAVGSSSTPYVILVEGGASIGPETVEALLDTVERRSGCGLVAGRSVDADGATVEAGPVLWSDGSWDPLGGPGRGPYDFERRIDASAGAVLLARRDVWDAVGGLDGAYHPARGPELVDLCLRARGLGWTTWYQPAAEARVDGAAAAPDAGEATRELLVERWAEFFRTREPAGRWERAVWRAGGRPTRLLVIDDEVSDPHRGSGYGRMHEVLDALDEATDIQVTFHPRVDPGERSIAELARLEGPRTRVVTDLGGHLASDGVDYDVVVVSRPPNVEVFRPLLDRRLPHAATIYDAEAVFFRRIERQLAVVGPGQRGELEREAARLRKVEESAAAWADRVVTISEDEAAVMRGFTAAPVHIVGPQLRSARPTPATFPERSGACLVAGWAAGVGSPNADGLRWFAREVLPLVRAQLPWFRLLVTGASPPADVTWAAGASVDFVGVVPDLYDVYDRVRVAISCTRFGSGVKLKTVEAVGHGVPVVGTKDAVSGLPPEMAGAVWVDDDPAGFAAAVVALCTDERAWGRARRATLRAASAGAGSTPGVEVWPDIVRAARAAGHRERRIA